MLLGIFISLEIPTMITNGTNLFCLLRMLLSHVIENLSKFNYFEQHLRYIFQTLDSVHSKAAEIGILDIAGFEQLQTNGFEQMCINMVNERLQQFMNNIVIIQEKKIYEAEEIPFDNVDFRDNMNIIQLFELKVNY